MAKALVVYDSMFGNTVKIANSLAAGLKNDGVDADIVKADAVKVDELGGVDLLCVGSPVHAWNMTKAVKEFLDGLKGTAGLAGKRAFAFDTKMKTRFSGSAADKIEKKLKDAGFVIAKRNETAIVKAKEGPLEEGAEEAFTQIGAELAKTL